MNQYGLTAMRHWARWLPEQYAAIPDPDSYFSDLGEEAAGQIADLTLDLAGDDPPGEDYLVKVGRLNMARLQAEEIILPRRVLPPPEPGTSQDEANQILPTRDQAEPAGREIPAVVTRDHPMWEQVNAEQEELARDS